MSQRRTLLAVSLLALSGAFPGAALAGPLPVITTESTLAPPVRVPPAAVVQQASTLASIPPSVYMGFTQAQLQQISNLVTQLLASGNFSGTVQQQLETVLENAQFAMQS